MSLATNLQSGFTRVAAEIKSLRTLINGNVADLAALTTTAKSNLVVAINEVNAKPSGGGGSLATLSDVTMASPANGHLLRYNNSTSKWENVLGTTYFDYAGAAAAAQAASQPLDPDLTEIAALTTLAFGRGLLTESSATSTKTTLGLATVASSGSAADLTGTLPSSALPALAINDVFVVASEAAMLALTAQRGDVAVRTDTKRTYILATDSPSTLGDWKELTASGDVLTVNGQTGTVVLTKSDVGLANAENTSDADKAISTATQAALDAKQALNANLTSIAAVATVADRMLYSTAANTWTLATLTAFGRSLNAAADNAAARVLLSVYSQAEIGDPNTDFVATFNAGLV